MEPLHQKWGFPGDFSTPFRVGRCLPVQRTVSQPAGPESEASQVVSVSGGVDHSSLVQVQTGHFE